MDASPDLSVKVLNDRDIVVTMPGTGFEITYRKDGTFPHAHGNKHDARGSRPNKIDLLSSGLEGDPSKGKGARLVELLRVLPFTRLRLRHLQDWP